MNEKGSTQASPAAARWTLEAKAGLVLFLGVLAFYALKAPSFSVPGRWAGMLSSFWGLEPFHPLLRPVWTALMKVVALLPAGIASHAVNLFSALVGAGACWLLFEIVRRLRYASSGDGDRSSRLMAGVFAGLMLAVSKPVMTVATCGDFYILDLFLLLLAFYPSFLFREKPAAGFVFLSFAFYGLALAENPTAGMVVPVFLLWWAYLLWRSGQLKVKVWLPAGLRTIAVCAAVIGVYAAARTAAGDVAGSGTGFLDAVVGYMRLYAAEMLRSVPKVGWLLLICTILLPLFFVVFRPMDEPTDLPTRMGVYSLRLILLALGVVTLFELPGSPTELIIARVMLVTPYALAALWFGRFLGYYHHLLAARPSPFASRAFAGVWIVAMLAAGVLHHRSTSLAGVEPVVAFAREVVSSLGNRTFLVTDGSMDASIRLEARTVRRDLNIINVRSDGGRYSEVYAAMFDDAPMRGAAHLGVRALLEEWTRDPARFSADVAVLASPHVVPGSAVDLVPSGAFYVAYPAGQASSAREVLEVNRAAWAARPAVGLEGKDESSPAWYQLLFVQRWSSRLANDIGVLLDGAGEPDLAEQAYEQALSFWPENISTYLNLHAQALASGDKEAESRWTARIRELADKNKGILSPAYARAVSGNVRNPMMSFQAAAQLIREGDMDEAMEEARRAAAWLDGGASSAQLEVARLLLLGKQVDESEKTLRGILAREPDNVGAYLGLMYVAQTRGDIDEAKRMLERAEELGLDSDRVALTRASFELAAGNLNEALKRYQSLAKSADPDPEVWLALARIAAERKDPNLLEEAVAELRKRPSYLPGQYFLGQNSLRERNFDDAQRYFERVLSMDAGHMPTLLQLAQMDYDRRDAEMLQKRTAAILAVDPESPYGHFFAASVHVAAGRLDLAEASLRRSLEARELDRVVNEIAWVLGELKRPNEAITFARRAVELKPGNANYWDTLSGIQKQLGDIDGAVEAIEKALTLSERRIPEFLLHAVRIYAAAGQKEKAQACLDELNRWTSRLPPDLQRQIKAAGESLSATGSAR